MKMKVNSISSRHILFIDNLIKHKFNATKAYQATYPDASYESAQRLGSQLLLRNVEVQKLLELKLNEVDIKKLITIEHVLKNLEKEAQTAKNSGDRIRANELCGKYLAMFTDKTEHSGTIEHTQQELNEYNRLRADITLSPTGGIG